MAKVFLTPEHAKSDYGKNGPGPIYDLKTSFGKQDSSKNPSGPLYSFGTADRFQKPSAVRSRRRCRLNHTRLLTPVCVLNC